MSALFPPNKPLEWTGNHQFTATPPQALGLPLKGSVSHAKAMPKKTKNLQLDKSAHLEY